MSEEDEDEAGESFLMIGMTIRVWWHVLMLVRSVLHRPAPHLVSPMASSPLGWRGRGAQGAQKVKMKQPSLERNQPNMEDKRSSVTLWRRAFPESSGPGRAPQRPLLAGGVLPEIPSEERPEQRKHKEL